jgi:WD40 repeat protein
VLDSARVKGWRTGDNPARWRGHLAGELPQPGKVKRVRHRPALGWQKIGALVRRIEGLPNAVLHLAFSPDGGRLAAMLGGDNGLRVYIGARGWDEVARDTQYSDESHGTAFSSDGSLATTSYDRKIRLYAADIVGSTQPIVVTKAPNGDLPFGIAFSPDGARLAIGYVDATTVDVVDARTLSPLLAWKSDGTQYGSLSTVAWSRNGRTLFAAGRYEQEGSVPARLECNQPWRTKGAADLQDYSDEPHSIVRRGSSCRWARSLARPASTRWDAALGARAAVGRFSCPAQDTLRFR